MRGSSERAHQVVLAALTDEAATTSDLYDRVGYMTLVRVGLVDFRAFREVLSGLERRRLAERIEGAADQGSLWRLPSPDAAA